MKFMPHDYQKRAIRKIVDQDSVGLFLDMGLGRQDCHHHDRDRGADL